MNKPAAFTAKIGRTPAGSIRIDIRDPRPYTKGLAPLSFRERNASIYRLAAELETRAEAAGAYWAISVYAHDGRIDVEFAADDDEQAAEVEVTKALEALRMTWGI